MKIPPLPILALVSLLTGGSGAIALDGDVGDVWETKAISDALGDGTLKVRKVDVSKVREKLPYFSVPVLNPADDQSLVDRCAEAIKSAVERNSSGLLVGELRQGGRAYWYVYATSIEMLDNAFESINEVCPVMWGNHHDSDWSEYGVLRSAS